MNHGRRKTSYNIDNATSYAYYTSNVLCSHIVIIILFLLFSASTTTTKVISLHKYLHFHIKKTVNFIFFFFRQDILYIGEEGGGFENGPVAAYKLSGMLISFPVSLKFGQYTVMYGCALELFVLRVGYNGGSAFSIKCSPCVNLV